MEDENWYIKPVSACCPQIGGGKPLARYKSLSVVDARPTLLDGFLKQVDVGIFWTSKKPIVL